MSLRRNCFEMIASRPVARIMGVSASGSPLWDRKMTLTTSFQARLDKPISCESPLVSAKTPNSTSFWTSTGETSKYEVAFQRPRVIDQKEKPADQYPPCAPGKLLFEWKRLLVSDSFCEGNQKPSLERPEPTADQTYENGKYTNNLGKWGECVLRVSLKQAEKDGLVKKLREQVTGLDRKTPDFVVTLPNSWVPILDSKAFGTVHDHKSQEIYAMPLLRVIRKLSAKDYSGKFPGSFGMTVMFVPRNEDLTRTFDVKGLDNMGIHKYARDRKILLATPSTLPMMLRLLGAVGRMDDDRGIPSKNGMTVESLLELSDNKRKIHE